ncbi:FAD binding domain-containing protein [Streptomyces rapamycinicus]|uniref:Molybdopterin dehydrogenase n=2 Tax=Streptomyces rapamycinicus TaxID=1226757 RepID=A0A0A0N6P9_STRRN|nr:FAD binding domain-containing protein [Streptomyces rapamycinicus]AGP52164.1 molybdopterin dehydrogenase [Streptomyces rapamycinicus NRRL 5491]MBB4779615.1 carbon-monoxide dehydrogenase medium subunit [Streptomyces rapamycinicus]RLV75725.1 molybdopterin dehydrogenase [Streptomyces rapamycinicus NRRL 5491]UTP28367.1 FAD binding domain-containing protein [Streptomyces rapamycinicus NRRL 5491]
MKAAPFAYVRPSRLSDAIAELAETRGGGKVIAGGQSLTPVLAMRLARPDTLIDINSVEELGALTRSGPALHIGATVRQRRVERDPLGASVPLLRLALPWVGHRELRSRGTVCGSLAHADPAAELPAVACCLDAELTLSGPNGHRRVSAREFFHGAMTTALTPDEILTSVRLPVAAAGEGFGFAEIARRHGDFALAGVAVRVRLRAGGPEATMTAFGVSDRPVTRDLSERLAAAVNDGGDGLAGRLKEQLVAVVEEIVDTDGDIHASRDYRRRLLLALAGRELSKAYERARDGAEEVTT